MKYNNQTMQLTIKVSPKCYLPFILTMQSRFSIFISKYLLLPKPTRNYSEDKKSLHEAKATQLVIIPSIIK